MGNIASYFSQKITMEEHVFGQTTKEEPVGSSYETPTRCPKVISKNQLIDPRSPTFSIDRTPIMFEVESEDKRSGDPRSPSLEITRTPVIPDCGDANLKAAYEKEREDLIQVLDFADLDCLSLSNIEEDALVISEELSTAPFPVDNKVAIPVVTNELLPSWLAEEACDLSLIITAASTPVSSPVKSLDKPKRLFNTTNVVIADENSIGKSNSSFSGVNSLLARHRVPFGDVNRPVLASPRLQLQNKQRNVVRSEILQHQRRYSSKND